eukprot:TRINITY_DN45241_c0_g1_i1.p1 TRINITY_DN45241_c0_g1~~TRINITY_DN45241_c0_g1_i1.p1  ORF type:complete len:206 (-),score=50.97 TRINITY_DN45241_c0_g1_i1:84-701(-)
MVFAMAAKATPGPVVVGQVKAQKAPLNGALTPGTVAAAAVAVAKPDAALEPAPEEFKLPTENDNDSWLELLRDSFFRQLREENEFKEPPPFNRANSFAAPQGTACPADKYPRQALNQQLQILSRYRPPEPTPAQKFVANGPNFIPKGSKAIANISTGTGTNMQAAARNQVGGFAARVQAQKGRGKGSAPTGGRGRGMGVQHNIKK